MIEQREKVAMLYHRAAGGDESAVRELDRLVASDEGAKQAYLNIVWINAQLPLSSALNQRAAEIPSPIQGSNSSSGAKSLNVETHHSRLSGSVVAAAAVLLVAAIAFALFGNAFQKTDTEGIAGTEGPAEREIDRDEEAAESLDAGVGDTSAIVFNSLSHPPRGGKVAGGIDVNDEPLPEKVSFNFHVRAILSENCFYCHGPDPNYRKADLRLDIAEGAEYAIEAGSPDQSELVARILSDDPDMLMPPPDSGRVITDRQKAILERWIEQGAQYEDHWSYVAVSKPEVPAVKNQKWPRNGIDKFVLETLERKEIQPSTRAEPEVIVRRLHLDLIGLPPSPEETAAFLTDYKAEPNSAIDRLVEQLLASPHYGERMALPWLDAARYSDSNGFQEDGDRAQWPWRDWVVDALNENMPFDQFTIQQLAGDLLPEPTQAQLIATGFNRNHMLNGEGGAIAEEQRNNYVFDRVDTTATTWLGLTMACAQCHDHKYDPITQKDYYQFFAYFNSVDENGGVNRRAGRLQCAKPFIEMPTDAQTAALSEVNKELQPIKKKLADADAVIVAALRKWEVEARKNPPKDMPRDIFNFLNADLATRPKGNDNRLKEWFVLNGDNEAWKTLKKEERQLYRKRGQVQEGIATIMIMRDREKPRQTRVLGRGSYETPTDEKVFPNVPHFLPPLPEGEKPNRLALAKWLVDKDNPLTSRVAVNRYWQTFFGTGLVKTSEDFGVQGELPSHPKLLDWLAVEFMDHGWDVKHIHRLIVTSETYLQSSRFRKDLAEIDPENRLLAKSPRFRMESTLIRDAALSVSGLLDRTAGGAPVYPWQPGGLWKEFSLERFSYKPSSGSARHRRSLYTFWRRTVAPPNMFDSANRQTCTVKISRTNTPLQALIMLNDPTYVEAFCHLASEVMQDFEGKSDSQRLTALFQRAVGREAEQTEMIALLRALEDSRDFYRQNPAEAAAFIAINESVESPELEQQKVELASLASVAQVVMNTDEFMTRE